MFFVHEEGTASSFRGVHDVILQKGLFSSLYTDRGSHYWYTPETGGKVSKEKLTQFGRAMSQLGIEMIPGLFTGGTWAKRTGLQYSSGPASQGISLVWNHHDKRG